MIAAFDVEHIESILDFFREVKRHCVDDKDMPNDPPTFMFVGVEVDDDELDAPLVPAIALPVMDDIVPAISEWITNFGPPAWVAVCNDAYVAHLIEDDDKVFVDLAELHAAGDKRVKEALTLAAAHHDGTEFMIEQTYWYDSDGDVWFDDLDYHTSASGVIMNFLRVVVALHGQTREQMINSMLNMDSSWQN